MEFLAFEVAEFYSSVRSSALACLPSLVHAHPRCAFLDGVSPRVTIGISMFL
jgi:hypothetical protein